MIGLLGTGRMGKLIERIAKERGDKIGYLRGKGREEGDPSLCSVFIDFSSPDALDAHIELALSLKKPIVIGTTGWNQREQEIKKRIREGAIGCIASPNFSIGVALFFSIVESAAKAISRIDSYESSGLEIHHSKKLDAPSGTAKELERLMKRYDESFPPFTALRVGHVPGEHQILFDSKEDTITLTHTARSREGFAVGALKAAEWIQGKRGFFTMQDFLSELESEREKSSCSPSA